MLKTAGQLAGDPQRHVFPTDYLANSSNPNSKARFAIVGPNGPEMFYVGRTANSVLWKTVLRDVFPEEDGAAWLTLAKFEGMSIAKVTPIEPLPLLALDGAKARQRVAPSRFDELVELTRVVPSKYALTHRAAREILAEVTGATGLRWRSRQIDMDSLSVVYQPAGSADLFQSLDQFELSSPEGLDFIDDVLEEHDYFRVPFADVSVAGTVVDDDPSP